jgi:hypothetical protein
MYWKGGGLGLILRYYLSIEEGLRKNTKNSG